MRKLWLFFTTLLFVCKVFAANINIIAAENFYAALAKELGGDKVNVQSILNNPEADPHMFATSIATSKALDNVQIIIYNGASYDAWMEQILQASPRKGVTIINVANLARVKNGDNPHLWYKPEVMPLLAKNLTAKLESLDKKDQVYFKNNLNSFLANNKLVQDKIAYLAKEFSNIPVIATEPVFGYMADAIGLKMKGVEVQWKIMNDTEPTPRMLADYKKIIITKQVKALFYNSQVTSPITKDILHLAVQNGIPVVGISETMPKQYKSVNEWMIAQLTSTEQALRSRSSKL